ncbi:MAG: hypothetical protein GF416_04060 [Candidatus Altiarchaeales archaeon]|nr:hypothetical protein [Candidatus Altiarchaeales archaeon]MBD3416294.1 hypothetical protein [Candidatus Altiarchaeales archaeon]
MDSKERSELEARLREEFERLNRERFDNSIEDYKLRFSKSSVRTHGSINLETKTIRISYPMYEQHGWEMVAQTLLHEMTHALIHQQGGHARHTKRFWNEFEKRGGVRDRIDVKPTAPYVYACPTCQQEIERIRPMKRPWLYSCIRCDRNYNPKHRLYLKREKGQIKLEC